MKILLLSTNDIKGGAPRATYRLHQGLQSIGVDSLMLVQKKDSDDEKVIAPEKELAKTVAYLKPILNAVPLKLYRKRDRSPHSLQWFPDRIDRRIREIDPDLINLHWIGDGFIGIETLAKFNKPIVWTLHDMWAFTGGCHYSGECDRYLNACGSCPQLHSKTNWDFSRLTWLRKKKAWQNLNLTVVTPSHWLAKCAAASSILGDFPIEVIPNSLDTEKYRPIDKQIAKKLLGLPPDKKIVLFGSIDATSDRRKGFHLLLPALQKLSGSGWQDRLELVVFGATKPQQQPNFGFPTHYLGTLADDISLSLIYRAADVFIAPSLQDNLPNTVMEAIACGTPCVGFKIGGMSDLIEDRVNGYLAKPFFIEDLAEGISWVLEDKRWQSLSQRAREKVEREFGLKTGAIAYLQLFNQILSQ